MPGLDGTGPGGTGQLTGRGFGKCKETNSSIREMGRGRCHGRNMGRVGGRRRRFGGRFNDDLEFKQEATTPENELIELKNKAAVLKNALNNINQKINELENKK